LTRACVAATLGGMQSARAGVLAGLFLVLAAAPGAANAQKKKKPAAEPTAEKPPVGRSLSLADVLQHAIRFSPALASARIDVKVAEARVLEASGIEDWVFGLSGSVVRTRSEPPADATFTTTRSDEWTARGSLSKLLFTGGRFSITGDTRRTDSTLFIAAAPPAPGIERSSVEVQTSVTARLDQPLLRGGWETVTRAEQGRAGIARDAAKLQRETVARTEVRDLIALYWEVAFAAADLEIRRSSVDLANERRRLTEASVKGGATAPTELNAVDQVIAQREEEVVQAELSLLQASLSLRQRAGIEIGPGEVEIAATSVLEVEPKPVELDAVVSAAFEESPEIAVLATRERGAKLEIAVTENGLLPRLDLSLYGGPLGRDNKFADSVERMTKFKDYQIGAELTFEYALGNNSAQGANQRAHAESQRVTVDMADIKAQIASSAVQAVALARSAEKRLELSRRAIELSEKNIKAEIGRFELGKSTNFDVLLRQDELKQARLRYARAVTDYLRARAAVGALTGELLPEYGVKVK
jgi:outer membrane protein TolC